MISNVLATGTPVRDAERIIERADGSRAIVSINVDALRDAKDNVVGAVNCFLDITERKRMDDELKHSRQLALEQEQRLAATYEHAAIGISEVAPDGSFLRVNEATCAITGLQPRRTSGVQDIPPYASGRCRSGPRRLPQDKWPATSTSMIENALSARMIA